MKESAIILLFAFLLDFFIGDPRYPFHPARLIGRLISFLENRLRALRLSGLTGGAVLTAGTILITAAGFLGLCELADWARPGLSKLVQLFTVYSCLALRDLVHHARPVKQALQTGDLEKARIALRLIVGRDVTVLDKKGMARAVVETVSESFLDGFLAPVFWYVVGALIAAWTGHSSVLWAALVILTYKTVNTLDSMVGYLNEKYALFGRVSARLDDALNFIPARLSLIVLFLAAGLCRFQAVTGLKTAMRDRLKHASPNSAHPESFAAGALGLRLGGPTQYPDGMVDKPWLGDGTPDATPADIMAVCLLILCAGWLSIAIAVLILQVTA